MSDANDGERMRRLAEENERLKRAVEELSVLNELGREIGASRDSKEVMERIVKRSIRALEAEQGVISLVDVDASEPTRTLVRSSSSSGDHPPLRANEQLLGWMHLHRRPITISDPRHDPRFEGARWGEDVRSILCVPMFVRSDLIGILTVFNKKSGRHFSVEDQRLLAIIAGQSAQVVENARLYEEERALMKVRQELGVAAEIQQQLLPQEAPVLKGYDLAGRSRPAENVGGDYYDFLDLGGDRLGICVADVSGKGLPAALLMASVQAVLRARYEEAADPAACLQTVGRLLYRSTRRSSFVSMIYAVVDAVSHVVTYANAGHNRPLLRTSNGTVRRLETADLVLGAVSEAAYRTDTVVMEPECMLLLYSDGMTEAMNARREEFGEERLVDAFRSAPETTAEDVLEAITRRIGEHVGDASQHDDMTMLLARRVE